MCRSIVVGADASKEGAPFGYGNRQVCTGSEHSSEWSKRDVRPDGETDLTGCDPSRIGDALLDPGPRETWEEAALMLSDLPRLLGAKSERLEWEGKRRFPAARWVGSVEAGPWGRAVCPWECQSIRMDV